MTTATRPAHTPSRACYLRGCEQSACRDKHLHYCKRYQYDTAHNGPRTTPATPYIPPVQALVTDGWTHQAIADQVGTSVTTIRDLAAGDDRHILLDTAALLDRGLPAGPPQNWWVDCTGTVRRLQALTVMGWPQHTIAAELGLGYSTIRSIANGRRRSTPRHTAQAVADLYTRWSRRPGPSPAAAGRARARGWHGPLAWDDIDNPAAVPEAGDIPALQLKRDELAGQRREEIWLLATAGVSDVEIARRVGVAESTVQGVRAELRTGKKRDRKVAVA